MNVSFYSPLQWPRTMGVISYILFHFMHNKKSDSILYKLVKRFQKRGTTSDNLLE